MATPVANSVGLSGNPYIDVIRQGSSWDFGGGAHVLTYSLSLNDRTPVTGWSGSFQAAIQQALGAWSAVADLQFVESGSGTAFTSSGADLAITLTGNRLTNNLGAVGLGVFPDPNFATTFENAVQYNRGTYPRPEGDVFLDNFYSGF